MESTTIRLTKKAKEEIKELVAFLSFKVKKPLTQIDVISLLAELGIEKKEELVSKITLEEEKNKSIEDDPFFQLPSYDIGKT